MKKLKCTECTAGSQLQSWQDGTSSWSYGIWDSKLYFPVFSMLTVAYRVGQCFLCCVAGLAPDCTALYAQSTCSKWCQAVVKGRIDKCFSNGLRYHLMTGLSCCNPLLNAGTVGLWLKRGCLALRFAMRNLPGWQSLHFSILRFIRSTFCGSDDLK